MPTANIPPETELYQLISKDLSQGIQALGQGKVGKWAIRRGMEFHSPWIWWGDVSKTREESYGGGPHEGLDFALAEMTDSGRFEANMAGLRIPAFTDGKILWQFRDLVGDTVIVATDHRINDRTAILQYSHIDLENVKVGDRLSQGDDIGKIALSQNPKSITASHLHLSVGLIDNNLLELPDDQVDFSNWLDWDQTGQLVYCDPIELLNPDVKASRFLLGAQSASSLSRLVSTGDTKEARLELRRTLARNFPGTQSLGKKSLEQALEFQTSKGLIVNTQNKSWAIRPYEDLELPTDTPLEGDCLTTLVNTLSQIEACNKEQFKA